MKDIERVGPYVEIVEARSPENSLNIVKVGVTESCFEQFTRRGQSVKCAQFYGIIQLGLIGAIHAFEGLKRDLMHADDTEADKNFVAYSWQAPFDYVWSHSRFGGNPTPKKPPPNEVFVVLVRQLKKPEIYPSYGLITGAIGHWSWIKEDSNLAHAPFDWENRYERKLWSRDL